MTRLKKELGSILLTCLLGLQGFSLVAQTSNTGTPAWAKGLSFGAGLGSSWIHGDLVNYHVFPSGNDRSSLNLGFHVLVGKEFGKGLLSAKVQFDWGSLSGGRAPGAESPEIRFQSNYAHITAFGGIDLYRLLFLKDGAQPRFFLNAEAGIGLIFWRAYTQWTGSDQRIRDFVGYTVTDENAPTQRYTMKGKTTPANAFTIPVGFTFGWRMNYKTDLTFQYMLVNTFTDRLDAFAREWTAPDKYSYAGLGLRYTLGRNAASMPDGKAKGERSTEKTRDKKQKGKTHTASLHGFEYNLEKESGVQPKQVEMSGPVKAKHSKPFGEEPTNERIEQRLKEFKEKK